MLAIAAQNVERRLKPMPSFPALVAKYAVLLWKIASMRLLGRLPEGQALDIGLHDGVTQGLIVRHVIAVYDVGP